jgi:serine protease Do
MKRSSSRWSRLISLVLGVCGLFCAPLVLANDNFIESLKQTELQIQSVVAENMETCVAVTDGIGFGSGVVVSEDGLVLTAGHVMASPDPDNYEVIFPSGRTVKARPLGKNLDVDCGMVQITEPGPWPFVELSDKQADLGQWVVSIGHPGGFEIGRKPPVRSGRILEIRGHQLVTDAVLIGGDSGGPLFDLEGDLIAIHSSIGDTVAENRHVDVATYRLHWDRMKSGQSWGQLPELTADEDLPRRAKLGVVVDRSADHAQITVVRPNSPAERIGLRPGDIVIRFDGEKITSSAQLIELIKNKYPGDSCTVSVMRDAAELHFQTVLDQF